ncbi:AdoMet-dependent rRNA methyltransferase SPB1 [Camellia lanceoleosa]|uniref:AdoMet-dependent rRNA methyltransferase SPB1 n=1 Tax=Camellia lanceoleosa TaxID=1840588 RepID=A0ACC0GPL4_9ERIC|nr:AdoMet-dependent rRNA methyltransferase SPB1 [Camellia lanceoleosa]
MEAHLARVQVQLSPFLLCVIDLYATLGGWMQVSIECIPVGSLVICFDLIFIRPIRGAISVEEDITKPQCRAIINRLMAENGCRAFDLVLHDGSQNAGGAWTQETTSQISFSGSVIVGTTSPLFTLPPKPPLNGVALNILFKIDDRVRFKIETFASDECHIFVKCSVVIMFGS